MILTVRSSMPGRVGGDADDTDVDREYDGDGISGIVGGCHVHHGGVSGKGKYQYNLGGKVLDAGWGGWRRR